MDDPNINNGGVKINEPLQHEIGENNLDALVLRLPASGLIPQSSLFVTESYTSSMRLSIEGILTSEQGGNISLKNEQILPFNVFVNRSELAEAMETAGKINLILSDKKITEDEVNKAWNYTASGLQLTSYSSFSEVNSDRVFLPENVVANICENNAEYNRLFSYLANSLQYAGQSIPYSFVTAMDAFENRSLKAYEIILSDYSAQRLNAQVGDSIWVSYYTSTTFKNLKEDSVQFCVSQIVPIEELQKDTTLSANFPGLSNVERCTEWDSDLPINMDQIGKEDEDYWEVYRTTPKAILPYTTMASRWKNSYGAATSIRLATHHPDLSKLTAAQFGVQQIYPRETGLYAAKNGVDFSSLFMALGFFIILSAMLLLIIPFSEMIYQRRNEIDLLKAMGYSKKRIARLLWMEASPVILLSAVGGVIAGFAYTALVMGLLGNVWQGATHTDGFGVYLSFSNMLIGFFVGILLSFALIYRVIHKNLKDTQPKSNRSNAKGLKFWAIIATILSIGILVANILILQSLALFMIIGVVLIGTFSLWGNYVLVHQSSVSNAKLQGSQLKWKTIRSNKKQALLAFFSLAMGVFIVFSVGLNRQDFSDHSKLITGTGGYALWCETSIPVYHDMNSAQGRSKLKLSNLPTDANILQCFRHQADEASCLNLNKVSTPTVLGINMQQLDASAFQIQKSINGMSRQELLERMQQSDGKLYPALVDATVLEWSLVKSIGDTLHYQDDLGNDINIQIVGTLANSVFQGNILIDQNLFSRIWKEDTGSEVFLVKIKEEGIQSTKDLLAAALNEYGVRITPTNERLKQFNSVTDTYLSIFLTLGGLGLLLGIFAFVIVIRKNLTMRQAEIKGYLTLGFSADKVIRLLTQENRMVPVYALFVGVISALVGVSASLANVGVSIWITVLFFIVAFWFCLNGFIKWMVKKEVSANEQTLPINIEIQ